MMSWLAKAAAKYSQVAREARFRRRGRRGAFPGAEATSEMAHFAEPISGLRLDLAPEPGLPRRTQVRELSGREASRSANRVVRTPVSGTGLTMSRGVGR